MKTTILSIVFFATVTLISAQEKAQIVFKEKKHNFGKIRTVSKDSAIFYFENAGMTPLLILKVTEPCGCITSEWTKRPVEIGKKGYVKVVFDPRGQNGKFSKSIYVKSNAENDVVILKIEGEIINNF